MSYAQVSFLILLFPAAGAILLAGRGWRLPRIVTRIVGPGVVWASFAATLYLFAKDRKGKSACSGSCAKFWPPLVSHGKPTAGAGVKASLLGTTRRSNGSFQVTYNKHPLYTFALDKQAGQTNGEGRFAFGAKWYAVSARGTAMIKASTTTTTTNPTTTCAYPPC